MRVGDLDALRVISLSGGIEMIPLGDEVRKRFRIAFLPLTDDGAAVLPDELITLCSELSRSGSLAYVEAEVFGGAGTQAYAMFENGCAVGAPSLGEDAINRALRKIGDVAPPGLDEFDYIGLGKHRDTEGWLE